MASNHKWIWKNLIGAAIFLVVVFLAVGILLNVITRHGKTVQTPDFTNLSVTEAEAVAAKAKVNVKVVDSVFFRRLDAGVVYRQNPAPGAVVKPGRSIFLTINSLVPRTVVMPNLYGYSVSEAMAEIQNRGLTLGRLTYKKDIATNIVLGWKCDGSYVKAGHPVVSGSVIDLVVGYRGENYTAVPRLIGTKYINAVDALHSHYLNVGTVIADPDIRSYADSLNAMVYKQTDRPGSRKNYGSTVSIFLTLDPSKLPEQ